MPIRYMLPILTIIAALLTSSVFADEARMDGWPDWLRKSMADENRSKKSRVVTTDDDSFRSRMLGKSATAEAMEGGWYFSSDIKAESPLECYLFTSAMDLATLANIIAESNIEAVGENYGAIDNRSIWHTDAGAIGNMPWLAVEWLYTAGEAPNNAVALTKVRAAARDDFAFACAHNGLGYRATFERGFRTFVENAEYPDSSADNYYEEIALINVADRNVGIGHITFAIDDEGDTRIFRAESSLTPVDESTLTTSDLTSVTWSTPDGDTINTWSTNVENGETANEFSVQRNDEGDWVVSGTMQQKPVEATISGEHPLTSELGQVIVARELFAGEETSATMDVWSASIDPTQPMTATLTRDDADIKGRGIFTVGPLSYTGVFDDDGNMREADMQIGPIKVRISRVWSSGKISE